MMNENDEALPETIYSAWMDADPESDEHFLTTEKTIADIAEKGEKKLVGVYKLERVVEVELKVSRRVIQKPIAKKK